MHASAAGMDGTPSTSHASIGAHRYWLLIHEPFGPAAHDLLLGGQQEEHAGREADVLAPLLALGDGHLLAEPGDELRQLGPGDLPVLLDRGQRLGLELPQPAAAVLRDALRLDHVDEQLALRQRRARRCTRPG